MAITLAVAIGIIGVVLCMVELLTVDETLINSKETAFDIFISRILWFIR